MLDPIVNFFVRIFQWIGRGIGLLIGVILWPFIWAGRWYTQRGWILKAVLGLALLVLLGLYANFFYATQWWNNFNPSYPDTYTFEKRNISAGEQVAAGAGADTARTCGNSGIAQIAADLTDFNVNQNAWISSMILYKLGLFGISWDNTPWMDNKASFQRGINQAVRRTATELADNLGRVRTTSQIDADLQDARGNLQFDEYTWYFGVSPFGPKTPTPSYYRDAVRKLRSFNARLATCQATFDARADNLKQYIDRIASDIGSTSAILKERAENHNNGWFDFRADDRYWFAYGQLYAYYGLMKGAQADFEDVIKEKHLQSLWDTMDAQFVSALRIQPFIIANGREDGWLLPTHLTTMGFYVLRVRSNMVEISNVLTQ
ncbi:MULTISPECIES: DUF2333 family protein [unclassified Mesorhizobium]|uniref:DUF2333 family protein n=1 Tax=unclassified Mesorhizobium TaxID=325217 RepID=UPI00112E2474|nr:MULTISPECIES: DUF2333 family protein [unclassified Mesorhizobium]MBZ9699484.1 DUF2333 family protein [Mesorhizobium sp. CO1-1-3]MBZ9945737.1 DUF2333 family protein [Mesorhizobium sp. BR1-1-11]TPJ08175.1 DUF2333 family protein [Mesorhizobium sp. B2-8-1]TPJ59371.1 DUF2333 family protein [Mesorhizobium sp. B2-6-1]TPL48760.1 DUF2333 family protein [Mesorhizobium sp. B2-4-4]